MFPKQPRVSQQLLWPQAATASDALAPGSLESRHSLEHAFRMRLLGPGADWEPFNHLEVLFGGRSEEVKVLLCNLHWSQIRGNPPVSTAQVPG